MPAAPHEQADRRTGPLDGARRQLHGLVQRVGADEPVRLVDLPLQDLHPAAHAGALPDRAVTAWRAHLPGELLEAELFVRRSIPARLDHVDHHLQARADTLDEVGLRHEVGPAGNVDLVAVRGAGGRGDGNGAGEGDGSRQRRAGEQAKDAPAGALITGHC